MPRLLFFVLLLVCLARLAQAQDATGLGGLPLGKGGTRLKMLSVSSADVWASKATPAGALTGLSTAPSSDVLADALRYQAPTRVASTSNCDASKSDFCYDASDQHIVYRPARALMPTIHGLTPESISVRRNGIRFKYSFP